MHCGDLSIVVPWRGRPELARTLASMANVLNENHAEVIAVNMGGSFEELLRCIPTNLKNWKCLDMGPLPFNKAQCLNIGIGHSTRSHILLLDADVIIEDDEIFRLASISDNEVHILGSVVEEHSRKIDFSSVLLSVEHNLTFIFRDGKQVSIQTNRLNFDDRSRAAPGIIRASRRLLYRVGGLNGTLKGWGWEDIDLIFRLVYQTDCRVTAISKGVHLTHSDRLRETNGVAKSDSEYENYQTCLLSYMNNEWMGTLEDDRKILPIAVECAR